MGVASFLLCKEIISHKIKNAILMLKNGRKIKIVFPVTSDRNPRDSPRSPLLDMAKPPVKPLVQPT